jgi:phosphoribosylanthranilate isomerase
MQRTRIKWCGFTREADIDDAVSLGVDAIGLIVVPQSKRALSLTRARELRKRVPAFVQSVLLFLDQDPAFIRQAIEMVKPDLLQFHGRELALDCAQFGWPYIKALSGLRPDLLEQSASDFASAKALLIDAHEPGGSGGSGHTIDWQRLPSAARSWILSGGLHADNVEAAVRQVRPFAVDAATGIEQAPGIKSVELMQAFMKALRMADDGFLSGRARPPNA